MALGATVVLGLIGISSKKPNRQLNPAIITFQRRVDEATSDLENMRKRAAALQREIDDLRSENSDLQRARDYWKYRYNSLLRRPPE